MGGGVVIGSNVDSGRLEDLSNLVSACPHFDVKISGVPVRCLVDTGSMVSMVTQSFFQIYFESSGQERLQSCH